MFPKRTGLIVWVDDIKPTKQLERYGTVHYVSKKMRYVVIYVNAERTEETIRLIQKHGFVKKVELSLRSEIKTEYDSNVPDKTRFYSY